MLCALLEQGHSGDGDQSSRWRHAIEDSKQNIIQGPLDVLLVGLRDLYRRRIRAGEVSVRTAVAELEQRAQPIYSRLALDLLREFGATAPDLVVERATSQGRVDDHEQFHELAEMIRAQFGRLPLEDQGRVVAALRENASESRLRSNYRDWPPDRLEALSETQFLRWLAILGDDRPADLDAVFEALRAKHGEPEERTFHSWVGEVQTGPNAPKSAADLGPLDDASLLSYLQQWTPTSDDLFAPSRSGLARELKACVVADSQRFSRLARQFRGHHSEYIAGLHWGLQEAIQHIFHARDERLASIDWDSILDLIEWAATQVPEADWSWPRQMAVSLLELIGRANLETDRNRVRRAWGVLRQLLDDEDPNPARIEKSTSDPETFVINTIRGHALQSVIGLCGALARLHDPPSDLISEMATQIESRCDPATEPSAAIRGVLGQLFSDVFTIDRDTALRLAPLIFPSAESPMDDQIVAWRMFLGRNPAHRVIFDALQSHYEWAADTVDRADKESAKELGEHLILLAAKGVLDPATPNGLLRRFLDHAPVDARMQAVNIIGRSIHRIDQPLGKDVIERLKRLWAWWLDATASTDDRRDVGAFAWWFTSDVFDDEFALSMLALTLQSTGGSLDWDIEVAEKLLPDRSDQPCCCRRSLRSVRHVRQDPPHTTLRTDNSPHLGSPSQHRRHRSEGKGAGFSTGRTRLLGVRRPSLDTSHGALVPSQCDHRSMSLSRATVTEHGSSWGAVASGYSLRPGSGSTSKRCFLGLLHRRVRRWGPWEPC